MSRFDMPHNRHAGERCVRIANGPEYERSGRRIIDATLDGARDIFEKADYTALGL